VGNANLSVWQGSADEHQFSFGLTCNSWIFPIFGEIWFLAGVGSTKVVCLAVCRVSLLQLMGNWLAGLGVIGACMEL